MLTIKEQIELGYIVCPQTKGRLRYVGEGLVSTDNKVYQIVNSTPILLDTFDYKVADFHSNIGGYKNKFFNKMRNLLVRSLREPIVCKKVKNLFIKSFSPKNKSSVYLSIGGGPQRAFKCLTNINLFLTDNVDVVASAYNLPYADNCVDGVYFGAVLEHLEFPDLAIKEACRVLKKGGFVFSITPFIQETHGSPSHYQNFTIDGHKSIFNNNNFLVIEAGPYVGAIYALTNLILITLVSITPKFLKKYIKIFFLILFFPLNFIDLFLCDHQVSSVISSATYIKALKK